MKGRREEEGKDTKRRSSKRVLEMMLISFLSCLNGIDGIQFLVDNECSTYILEHDNS